MLPPSRTGVAERASAFRRTWPSRGGTEAQLVVGLTLLAAVLRLASLSHQSYWLDESQAVHELRLPFGAMLHAWSTTEWNPPLYLLVAWPWAKVFGTGEIGLRALSALLGVGVIPLLYLSGRDLISSRAGVMAAALAAVNPFLIWYSQEAREYMLLGTLCAASLWCFARAWREPTGRALLWWAVLSGLALLTQYFAGFLVAAEGLALVYRARSRASVLALVAQAVVLAPFVPARPPALSRGDGVHHRRAAVGPAAGSCRSASRCIPSTRTGSSPTGCSARRRWRWRCIVLLVIGTEDRELRGAGVAAMLAAAVLVVPLLLALVGHDDYLARGLLPGWLPLALVIGAACAAPRARVGGAAAGGGADCRVRLRPGQDPVADAGFEKPNWRGVAAALGRPTGPRAIVAYDGTFATGPLSIYLPARRLGRSRRRDAAGRSGDRARAGREGRQRRSPRAPATRRSG